MYSKTKALIKEQMAKEVYPGAVYAFLEDKVLEKAAVGDASVLPKKEKMTENKLFDVASLTKVVCTTTVVLRLQETGRLNLDASLTSYLPTFENKMITLRHLLTHTSDIKTWIPNRDQLDADGLRAAYMRLEPGTGLGDVVQYTDAGTILLGFMLEELFQKDVIDIFREEVLQPLHMTSSSFLPQENERIVPTEIQANGTPLRGLTHDPKARILREHAGNAGLFTTLGDLLLFAKMYLDQGKVGDQQFLRPETIMNLLVDQTPSGKGDRSIGWDLKHDVEDHHGMLFHTGYTGTFMLIDPIKASAFIFLSNRVHLKDDRVDYLKHRDQLLDVYLNEKNSIRVTI